MASPKPKPTRLRVIEGNPGKGSYNQNEAQPPKAKGLRAPSYLCPLGRAEYRRMTKLLEPLGLLTSIDLQALALYADQFATWRRAIAEVHEEGGLQQTTVTGYKQQTAALSIANQASKRMQSLLSEFGMTPSSRSKIVVEKKKGDPYA